MAGKLFVETGRVALINYGPDYGKWVVILDVVDQNRVLADGSANGVKRQTIPLKWLSLLNIKIKVPRTVGPAKLAKFFAINDVAGKVAATSWGKKIGKQAIRANLTDFERFKVMLLKKQKAKIVNTAFNALKATKA